jgi:hypothetical protein
MVSTKRMMRRQIAEMAEVIVVQEHMLHQAMMQITMNEQVIARYQVGAHQVAKSQLASAIEIRQAIMSGDDILSELDELIRGLADTVAVSEEHVVLA